MSQSPAGNDGAQAASGVTDPVQAVLALRTDLRITPDLSSTVPGYTLEDPLRGKFYRMGLAEYTLSTYLNGRNSIAAAAGMAARQLGRAALSENEALAVCRWLLDCQLAHTEQTLQVERLAAVDRKNARKRWQRAVNPLFVKIPLFNPDPLLARVQPWAGVCFSPLAVLVWIGTCLAAIYFLVSQGRELEGIGVVLDRSNWLCLAAIWVLLKVLHETAHALACKQYGGTVPAAGITLLLLAPLAYVDVTSCWRFRWKWQRIVTAMAGIYVELFAASIGIIVWAHTGTTSIAHHLARNVAVTAGISTLLFNGNPLVRFDGYFVLADLVGIPNLYSQGQQWLVRVVRSTCTGQPAPQSNLSTRHRRFIPVYAVAALAWRVVFFLALALGLVGMLDDLGILLAVVLLGFGWGVPMWRFIGEVARNRSSRPWESRRVLAALVCLALPLVAANLLLSRPGRVRAPAVVDYATLAVVRAETPGFVRKICVRSGEHVATGQLLAVLENRDLEAEAEDLELSIRQSALKQRMYHQEGQWGKCQVERATQESLEKKAGEVRLRRGHLEVRTPVAGCVSAIDLDSLLGRYLSAGEEVATVGGEAAKELLVAVPQDDVAPFLSQLGHAVRVRADDGPCVTAQLRVARPRASAELPHPAFAATAGGPLPVREKAREPNRRQASPFELLAPTFVVKAELSPDESGQLYAGQRVNVSFECRSETIAARIWKWGQGWVRRQMARE